MNRKRINNTHELQINATAWLLFLLMLLPVLHLFAQEQKQATLKLSFTETDSTRTCKATLLSDNLPVKETEVHLYVKGYYSLLPVGKVVATDENGEAEINFPMDLPGDKNDLIVVIAKVEKDAIYGNVETQAVIKWGVASKSESYDWGSRSLSASREKAPTILVVASILAIALIWGVIFYVIFQLVEIKKSARIIKKISVAVH